MAKTKEKIAWFESGLPAPAPPPESRLLRTRLRDMTLDELRADYLRVSEPHNRIFRQDYRMSVGPYEKRGSAEVEEDLRKLRSAMRSKLKARESLDHLDVGLQTAFAIREFFEIPKAERGVEPLRELLPPPLQCLARVVQLASHWSNNLIWWADAVLGDKPGMNENETEA